MIKGFPIDFIRQTIEQTLLEQHIINPNFYGGKNQVCLFSLYEQLLNGQDVDRYVETFRELTEQQNRCSIILNGVLSAPENPTITNLYSSTIIPMDYTCVFRCKTRNRDQALETLNNLIEELKGRKVDIAQLKCETDDGYAYAPFVIGTIGENDGEPILKNGDYIGEIENVSDVSTILSSLSSKGVKQTIPVEGKWLYCQKNNKLVVVYYNGDEWQIIVDDGSYDNIVFPPEHINFEKYKLSLSFDAMRCDTPFNLNGDEVMMISFGGSATLVSNGVKLGNDLIKISVSKYKIPASPQDITFNDNITYLEPLEMPSGNNISTNPNQLASNLFKTNDHADAIALTLQYTFIIDENVSLLEQWFNYGRYGDVGTGANQISPNLIYKVNEYYCSWGNFKNKEVLTKIVGDIDIENTESDTLTIGVSMQIQGENN